VDHEGKDTHLGGTSLVELDGTLLHLGVRVKGVPAIVDSAVSEVTDEFTLAGDITHDELQEETEANDLAPAFLRDSGESTESRRDIREAEARVVDVSGKTDTGRGDEVTGDGKHGDTSVLELDLTKAVEAALRGVAQQTQGVEEAKLWQRNKKDQM
jgi:hypothetical protein